MIKCSKSVLVIVFAVISLSMLLLDMKHSERPLANVEIPFLVTTTTPDPVTGLSAVSSSSSIPAQRSWCKANSFDEVQQQISPLNIQPPNVTDIKASLGTIMNILHQQGSCLGKCRKLLKAKNDAQLPPARYFIDMGSRNGDQTTMFLNKFPDAQKFEIHCFEANPAFNNWYRDRPNLKYHNKAVGVSNSTLWLSNRDVGSSIVDGKGPDGDGILVDVIDFPAFLIQLLAKQPQAQVIIKMDIEKMEYAVLLRMFQTGAILLVDDLLLECHYTTNKPKGSRPPKSIGKDDCIDLVALMNSQLNSHVGSSSFEAVLWNSVRTAKASGYSLRHGGFHPT